MGAGQLIQSENLVALRRLPDASIDLIYLDPPFRSEKDYKTTKLAGDKSGKDVFDDRWRWNDEYRLILENSTESLLVGALEQLLGRTGRLAYLLFMIDRLIEMNRLLKSSGSIALHCDQSASAHLKIVLDALFGNDNFLNTIVWCYGLGGSSHRRFPRKHDDILWYSRTANNHYFQPLLEPARSERMKGKLKKTPDYWQIPAIDESDHWYIPSINNMAHERTGYPTQKPLALLERIILAASPPEGTVLDPFCGSGTTLIAAASHERSWIGIDNSTLAIETAIRRLESEGFDRNMSFQKWGG